MDVTIDAVRINPDQLDDLNYLLTQWDGFYEEAFIVSSEGGDYRVFAEECRASAFITYVPIEGDQAWTLSEDNTLTVSHPTGETYTVRPLTPDSLKDSGAEDDYLSDLLDIRAEQIVAETAFSHHCHSDADPSDYRDAEDVRQHMGFESVDEVYAMAERVAHAEWQDDRLRSICYDDIVADILF